MKRHPWHIQASINLSLIVSEDPNITLHIYIFTAETANIFFNNK